MEFQYTIPFVKHLGIELLRHEAGEAELAVTLKEELCNSWQVAHGGMLMTLLDVAMAHAAREPQSVAENSVPVDDNERGRGVVTVEMKTSFLRPGLGRLVARSRLLQATASLAFCEASVNDENGALVAHATGTFKYLRGLPAGRRKIQRNGASD